MASERPHRTPEETDRQPPIDGGLRDTAGLPNRGATQDLGLGVVLADELSRLGPTVHTGGLKDRRDFGV